LFALDLSIIVFFIFKCRSVNIISHLWTLSFTSTTLTDNYLPSTASAISSGSDLPTHPFSSYIFWYPFVLYMYNIYNCGLLVEFIMGVSIRVMVLIAIFNNISGISWRSVLLVEDTGVPRKKPATCCKSLTSFIT
jgi:hypothetical protein